MNTKAMIEFLDREYKYLFDDEEDKYDELIALLKENEKYKKIVEEIDERLMPGKVNAVECLDHTNMGELSTLDFVRLVIKDIDFVRLVIKDIKKKYSLKTRQKTVSFDIEFDSSGDDLVSEIETLIAMRKFLNIMLPKGVILLNEGRIMIKPYENVQES